MKSSKLLKLAISMVAIVLIFTGCSQDEDARLASEDMSAAELMAIQVIDLYR